MKAPKSIRGIVLNDKRHNSLNYNPALDYNIIANVNEAYENTEDHQSKSKKYKQSIKNLINNNRQI